MPACTTRALSLLVCCGSCEPSPRVGSKVIASLHGLKLQCAVLPVKRHTSGSSRLATICGVALRPHVRDLPGLRTEDLSVRCRVGM